MNTVIAIICGVTFIIGLPKFNVEAGMCSVLSKNYPNDYSGQTVQKWILSGPHNRVAITFNTFATEERIDFVRFYSNGTDRRRLAEYHGKPTVPFEKTFDESPVIMIFTSDFSRHDKGFSANVNARCEEIQTAPTGNPWNYQKCRKDGDCSGTKDKKCDKFYQDDKNKFKCKGYCGGDACTNDKDCHNNKCVSGKCSYDTGAQGTYCSYATTACERNCASGHFCHPWVFQVNGDGGFCDKI